jgi:NitT/TauT family transport system substrate-binding protein
MEGKMASALRRLFLSVMVLGFFHGATNTAVVFAQAKPPVKIRIATSTGGLDFAPIWIAQRKGYFKEESVDFEHVLVTGGAATMAALISGEVQFVATAASDVPLVRQRGDRILAIGAFPVSLDWNIAVGSKWLGSKGLTGQKIKNMAIKDKVLAMQGATVGAATVGGAPAQVTRYLVKQYGIAPGEEVKIIAVGAGPSRVAALRQGQVDMIVGGIPDTEQPELEGWGVTYIRLGSEVEVFRDYPHETLAVLEGYAQKNPDVVTAVARALARGNNLMIENPAESDKLLQEHLPKISPAVLKAVMGHARGLFRRNMRMTRSGWNNIQQVFLSVGALKAELDTTEGSFWTNKYLP